MNSIFHWNCKDILDSNMSYWILSFESTKRDTINFCGLTASICELYRQFVVISVCASILFFLLQNEKYFTLLHFLLVLYTIFWMKTTVWGKPTLTSRSWAVQVRNYYAYLLIRVYVSTRTHIHFCSNSFVFFLKVHWKISCFFSAKCNNLLRFHANFCSPSNSWNPLDDC